MGLAGIYAVWLAVVVSLYPLCRWFAGIKRRRTEWWWRYF
jgi:heme exporter protein D